jgi:hypothetical protein
MLLLQSALCMPRVVRVLRLLSAPWLLLSVGICPARLHCVKCNLEFEWIVK